MLATWGTGYNAMMELFLLHAFYISEPALGICSNYYY